MMFLFFNLEFFILIGGTLLLSSMVGVFLYGLKFWLGYDRIDTVMDRKPYFKITVGGFNPSAKISFP